MLKIGRLILSLFILLTVVACAPLASIFGYSGTAIQAASQLDQVKLLADGVSFVSTGKTVSDHAISAVTGSDCNVANVLDRAPVCVTESQEQSNGLDKN